MKKIIIFMMACLSLTFAGCNKENEGENENTNKEGAVRYEASVSDPVNYKIQVGYMDKEGGDLKQEIVESPFKYELQAKHGTYLYISVKPVPRVIGVGGEKKVSCKMYIENKLHKEDSGENAALVQYLFGQD